MKETTGAEKICTASSLRPACAIPVIAAISAGRRVTMVLKNHLEMGYINPIGICALGS